MKIKEIMSRTVVSAHENDTADTVAKIMKKHDIGCVPIVNDDNKLTGIITDRDMVLRLAAAGKNPIFTKISDIMTRDIATTAPEADVAHVTEEMGICKVRRIPVVENGKLVGIASLGDVAVTGQFQTELSSALCDISGGIKRSRK